MEMEGTGDGSVEQEDPHEWSPQQVATFLRALGTAECFQSAADQVLQLGVDGSVFFELSLDQLQGVCGHARAYARMCECKHSSTDVHAIMVAQTDHSSTLACDTL
jgi:hypothetical protein